MDGISSTPIENSVEFLRLRDKYKSAIFDDSRLTKAAGLAAKKELLLESAAPDTCKVKAVNRGLQHWVKKIRQPCGTRGIGQDVSDSDVDEDERNLAVGPFHQFMGNISKLSKAMQRKAEPVTPPLQTPVVKQRPSTIKKVKRVLPATPKTTAFSGYKKAKKCPLSCYKVPKTGYKTPKKPPSPASSVFDTADEDMPATTPLELSSKQLAAELPYSGHVGETPWRSPTERESERLNSIKRSIRKLTSEDQKSAGLQQSAQKLKQTASLLTRAQQRVQRRALEKLAPAPGWKPFGTPTKRRMDGKDW